MITGISTQVAITCTYIINSGKILTPSGNDNIVICTFMNPLRMPKILVILFAATAFIGCNAPSNPAVAQVATQPATNKNITQYNHPTNTIHVLVALCDNKYQGIVPVPAAIGNGQNPAANLYWGCAYGIKGFFSRSANWQLLKRYTSYTIDSTIMERLVFKHRQTGWYMVADAYNGQYIKQCTVDFLKSCAGMVKDTLQVSGTTIGFYGNARLLAYIGHDGLMDFSLTESFANADKKTRDAVMLACISKKYFAPHLQKTGANPLLWSTGLMAPEAYILHDALESYLRKEPAANIRSSAAKAYSRYQHCSIGAATKLLVSGY
jgi:hypothetical protein